VKESLKIAAVFIGTIVGAGLASGQEILQFFALCGIKGFYGILVCCLIYIVFSIIIVNLCFSFKFKSYKDIILSVLGKKLGRTTDIVLTFFIFAGNTIMISGGGAMLNEYARINKSYGILIMAALSFIVTAFSTKGLITVNSLIVPLSTTTIILLGLSVFLTGPATDEMLFTISNAAPIKKNWVMSSTLYAAFNLMTATGVLCPLALEVKSKKNFLRGCLMGIGVLTVLALIINFLILSFAPKSFHNEIPNLFVAKQTGKILPLILTIIIWLEMFSTEVGDLYSLAKRFQSSFNFPYITSLLLVIFFSIPVSFIGFSNLIRLLYPPFGAVSLIFLIGCVVKCIRSPFTIKNH
jgi:uncharacterized membrane protein YkvI